MILKMHVYSRVSLAIMIAFLTGSIVFMAFDTTPPYEYDESASFVVRRRRTMAIRSPSNGASRR